MRPLTHLLRALVLPVCCVVSASCSGPTATAGHGTAEAAASAPRPAPPAFSADSARAFVGAQCDFGPRVPGTDAHRRCADWLAATLRRTCDTLFLQQGEVTTFDGHRLAITNLVGAVNPAAERRILLLAHWDCRPWADADADPSRRREPVMGANDAASGVAVLLELARQMSLRRPDVGVDLLLTDAEDWGTADDSDSWALGTQYWAAQPHVAGYRAMYGILLDMVGAKGAVFAPEYYSRQYADGVVRLVWDTARQAGYGAFFVERAHGAVTDDHVVVNQRAGIPCIDIIDQRADGFFSGWHTTADTPDVIDPATLKAVGQTLTNLIYSY